MPFFGQLSFDPLYIVQCEPFNSAQGFDLEVTDGAMRSKKGKKGGEKARKLESFPTELCRTKAKLVNFVYIFIY